jgi:hypothetical protein
MPDEITIVDCIARVYNNIECPLCRNSGKVMLSDDEVHLWKHPRPCPICQGVGQIHKDKIPTEDEIAYKMTNYFKFK